MKTLLVPLDFSDVTKDILNATRTIADAFNSKVHFIHAIDPGPSYEVYGFSPAEIPSSPMLERIRSTSEERLLSVAKECGLPAERISTECITSLPVQGILSTAREQKADLIIIGSHGHGFLASILLGSVAQGVIRHAEFPTLVIPHKGANKNKK